MFSFKRSLVALVGLLVLVGGIAAVMPLVSRGQGQAPFGPRKFYLTQTTHTGSQALTACAAGYHMASLYEILDPSNLRYDTALGATQADSGFGPPVGELGWVRSGYRNDIFDNCLVWTSADSDVFGATATLRRLGNLIPPEGRIIDPWEIFTVTCGRTQGVWCVQD